MRPRPDRLWRFAAPALAAVLAACGGVDTAEQPVDLPPFKAEARFERLWQRDAGDGDGGYALNLRPAVDGDVIYSADHEGRLAAWRLDDGERLWRVETGLRVASGPTVWGGLLFVGTSDGELAAYWSEDGRPAWRSRVSSEALSTPAVDAGIVVVHAVDGMIQAYDTRSGERLWTHSTSVPTLSLRGVGDPIATGGAVLCGTDDGRLVALALRDGRLLFELPVALPAGHSELSRMVDVDVPPLVDGQVLYVAAYQGQVTVFDLARGANPWSRRASVYTPMALDGDSLYYVDEPGHVQALDRYSGEPRWRQEKLHARLTTGVALAGDAVLVGDFDGYLHALDRGDGRLIARIRVGDALRATPRVLEDGRIVVASRDGRLSVWRLVRPDA